MRICLGVLLLCDIAVRYSDLEAHYSDDGVLPISTLPLYNLPISVHLCSGAVAFQAILFYLHGFAALALLLGWMTRYATPIAWFLTISVHARNPLVITGGDAVLRMLLFWGIFLPLGASYSVDSLSRPRPPKRVLSMASVALVVQVWSIYLFAGLMKYGAEWRNDGNALYMALSVGHFTTPLAKLILQSQGLMTFLTFATLVQEIFVPLLLFMPWKTWFFRLVCIVSFIGFHTMIGQSMRLGTFQPLCIVGWLALLPTEFWDWLARRLRNPLREGLVLYRDADSGPQLESIRAWTTLLMLADTPVRMAQEDPKRLEQVRQEGTWIAVDRAGKVQAGRDAVLLLLRVAPLFWPLAYLLGWILPGGERKRPAQDPAAGERVPPPRPDLPPAVAPLSGPLSLLVGLFMVYGFVWNLRSWREPHQRGENFVGRTLLGVRDAVYTYTPPQTMILAYALALEQDWSLFAPFPGNLHGWFVTVGTLENGKQVDVTGNGGGPMVPGGRPVSWERPELISATYPDTRWQKYLMNLISLPPDTYPLRAYYALYLTKSWNSAHPDPGEQLKTLEIYVMEEITQRNYQPNRLTKIRVCKLDCRTLRYDLEPIRSAP
jgi:hypothetical protein